MKLLIETKRLRLREFTTADTAFIIELLNTPGWLKFIGDRNVRTQEQAIAYLENGPLKSYRENGFGLAAVELKSENIVIGMCGVLKRNTLEHPDIGFALLPDYTGKGYAFEIAQAMLKHATCNLNSPTLCAVVDPRNMSSIKLLEKLGLRFKKNFRFPDGKEDLLLFSRQLLTTSNT